MQIYVYVSPSAIVQNTVRAIPSKIEIRVAWGGGPKIFLPPRIHI